MDHRIVSVFLITLVVVNGQLSARTTTVKCPNVTSQQNFDIKRYMGKWYEIERYDTIIEANTDCISSIYTLFPNSSFAMNNTFVKDSRNQSMISMGREANTSNHNGILKVSIPNYGEMEGTVYVLGTDYIDYTILWACIERNNSTPLKYVWVLGRNITISPAKQTAVNIILQNNNITQSKFIKTKHDPKTCWKKNAATLNNSSILLLTFAIILKYFL